MNKFCFDNVPVDLPIKKHPTREILESGGIVDGESFEIMLKEEAEQEKMDWLESINYNLIQLNRNIYEMLLILKSNNQ